MRRGALRLRRRRRVPLPGGARSLAPLKMYDTLYMPRLYCMCYTILILHVPLVLFVLYRIIPIVDACPAPRWCALAGPAYAV